MIFWTSKRKLNTCIEIGIKSKFEQKKINKSDECGLLLLYTFEIKMLLLIKKNK